jgi:hypothetical protein
MGDYERAAPTRGFNDEAKKSKKRPFSKRKTDCQENHQISHCLSVNTLGQHNDARAP